MIFDCRQTSSFELAYKWNIALADEYEEALAGRLGAVVSSEQIRKINNRYITEDGYKSLLFTLTRIFGCPTTTSKAFALVIATLNLLGFLQNPTSGFSLPFSLPWLVTCIGKLSSFDSTVEMKITLSSWPCRSSTVPTLMSPRPFILSNCLIFWTCTNQSSKSWGRLCKCFDTERMPTNFMKGKIEKLLKGH